MSANTDKDDLDDDVPAIPAGSKNYITPDGFKKLQDELVALKTKDRPHYVEIVAWAASLGDRSENADYHYGKRKLAQIDKRIRFISKRIDIAEIVDPKLIKDTVVRFGATVTILDEDGVEKTYKIVGIDEINLENGFISWISPLANALFKSSVGDFVTFKTPKGSREVEIINIEYI